MTAEEILAAAIEKKTPAERAAYLDAACGQDAGLRALVDGLLKSHEEAGSFLNQSLFGSGTNREPTGHEEQLGATIGPYKLIQRLGQGGMGSVYLAEQKQPVQRRVALKIVRSGMDSARVLARFDQERQALTMMEHPNIARALDAGSTETGRPYFVMELVNGIPITRYCDQEHLTPGERLELFIPVCQAVQHAHQKGIIHRDIKPSNVLIALCDGVPVPKVIDFGVAKATSQKLAERTLFTEVGSIVGTLEYMAPEQAELNNLDIDTRADIYSLGVLLYELLTGSPPFTSQQLRSAAFMEMLRLIREVEPPRPSTRLSNSGELASIAANRKLEPTRLKKLVQDDLDWIVMKALEKDRARRYESATALADDVERYLHDEPVLASPPCARYRLRKFWHRNKRAVLAAAVVVLALVGGIAGTTWGLVQADQALDIAEKLAREKGGLAETERQSRERAEQQSELTLKTLNSVVFNIQGKLTNVPGVQEIRRDLIGTAIDGLNEVARNLDSAPRVDHALIVSHMELGDIFLIAGDRKGGGSSEAREQFEIARILAEKLLHDAHPSPLVRHDLPVAYSKLGDAKRQLGDTRGARDAFQESLRLIEKLDLDDQLSPTVQRVLLSVHERLGDVNLRLGNTPVALLEFKKGFAISEKFANEDPHGAEPLRNLYTLYHKLGTASLQLGDAPAARNYYLKSLELNQNAVHDNPGSAVAQRDLSCAYESLADVESEGNVPAAREGYGNSLAIREKLARDDPLNVQAQRDLAQALARLGALNVRVGETVSAVSEFRTSLEINQKLARDDPQDATTQANLAKAYLNAGDVNRALNNLSTCRDAYQTAHDIYQRLAHDDPGNAHVKSCLAAAHNCLGDANLRLGNVAIARDDYRRGLNINQELADDDPLNVDKQAKLAYSFGRLGDLEIGNEDFSAALPCFARGVEILGKLEQSGKLASRVMYQRWLAEEQKALAACQTAGRAIDSLEFALGRPRPEVAVLLGIRGRVLARHGQHGDAAAAAEKLAALEPVNGENLFQAAEAYALSVNGTEPENSPAGPASGEPAAQIRSAARAIELLNQAHAAGYFGYPETCAKLNDDHNLDAIRRLDDFKKLAAEVASAPAIQRPPIFKKWSYLADERGDSGSFEMGDSDWVELKKGKIYARFQMTETATDHVELYDKSRRMWLRLNETTASYSTDQKKWTVLYEGAPVHDVAPQTVSCPSSPATGAVAQPKSE